MFNYDNIGGKIKGLAKAFFIIGAIASVIAGLVLISQEDDLILAGFVTLVMGPIMSCTYDG